jgi:uncharacterized membrane protein
VSYSINDAGIPQNPRSGRVNVGEQERIISAAAGGALAGFGLGRGSIPGLLLVVVGGGLVYRGLSGHCSAYEMLGLDTAGHEQGARPSEYFERGIHLEEAVTINKPPSELYEFWRNFENLPRFMHNLESVQLHDELRSHWVAKGPAGKRVEWEAEIINEVPGELIAWKTLGDSDVHSAGSVRFVSSRSGRGTEVKVVMDYLPPGGRFGRVIAFLLGRDPAQQIKNDLRRFKQLMETGEIADVKGQPAGAGRLDDESPTGHRVPRTPRTHDRSRTASLRTQAGAADIVSEASQESFPASDPPGYGSIKPG